MSRKCECTVSECVSVRADVCECARVCVCVSHAFGQTQSDPSRCSTPFLRTHPKTVVLPQSHPFTLSLDTPRDEQYTCRTQLL